VKSLYGSAWLACPKNLLHSLVVFAISGIKLPKTITIEGLTANELEDKFNVNFEEVDAHNCILQIPYIVLSIILYRSNLVPYKYEWLQSSSYLTGPLFEQVDACFEETWNLAYKLKEGYLGNPNTYLTIGEYYRGAIVNPKSKILSTKIVLPLEHTFVESFVQLAAKAIQSSEDSEKKSKGNKPKGNKSKRSQGFKDTNKNEDTVNSLTTGKRIA
jgi:hypothetical protein